MNVLAIKLNLSFNYLTNQLDLNGILERGSLDAEFEGHGRRPCSVYSTSTRGIEEWNEA